MFAEELTSNAGKKRQEDAKKRRRQLLAQKQKAKAVEQARRRENELACREALDKVTATGLDVPPVPVPMPEEVVRSPTKSIVSAEGGSSAAEKALKQRSLRSAVRLRTTAATSIQACWRRRASHRFRITTERRVWDSRIQDVITLGRIVTEAGKGAYIPPPATVRQMVTQYLFIAGIHSTDGEDVDRLRVLLRVVVLPGLMTTREVDPLFPLPDWTSGEGRLRLSRLLRCCWQAMTITTTRTTAKASNSMSEEETMLRLVWSCHPTVTLTGELTTHTREKPIKEGTNPK